MEKIAKSSLGHYLYDGTAVYADSERAGFTVWALDAKDAQQAIAQKAVQHRPSVSMLYVESVYRRQDG